MKTQTDPLSLSSKTTLLPIVHGSGDCALLIRQWMLEHHPDCLAVPLPPSFREPILAAIEHLCRRQQSSCNALARIEADLAIRR